jgi:hypothetical protein
MNIQPPLVAIKRSYWPTPEPGQPRSYYSGLLPHCWTASPMVRSQLKPLPSLAGVSKATIYRWWPNKVALVIEVLTEQALHMPQIPFDGRNLRNHLLACLKGGYKSLLRGRMTPVLSGWSGRVPHGCRHA